MSQLPLHEKGFDPMGRGRDESAPKPPKFCPVCGRPVWIRWSWTTVSGDEQFPMLACYGGMGTFRIWLHLKFSTVTPNGAHYVYELKPRKAGEIAPAYDRETGEPI